MEGNRLTPLPGGCKNLNDIVRVLSARGRMLKPMTLAAAQTLAAKENCELVHLASGKGLRVFRLVDDALREKIRRRKSS